ncbi:MAG: thioredoxin domain-containing protein [Cytophagales bacterium]|nr:thioredoxin domain-containing protein [Cytophagales bacterium]
MPESQHSNPLIHESSPYLLQHARNPVNWQPWNSSALKSALEKDKAILLSIGYSSCHWCHVMEKESFENKSVARLMNENFVCIKIDREERPDLDALYMDAVQKMGFPGGWPLHVFLTPEQKPFYGGTYFSTEHWKQVLTQIALLFASDRPRVERTASEITDALNISLSDRFKLKDRPLPKGKDMHPIVSKNLLKHVDFERGGLKRVPKFPMPSVWELLLDIHQQTGGEKTLKAVVTTLKAMACGGIYDQIGGGFCRYSTDGEWFAPHFEKMLYDNGQLVSLFAKAFSATRLPLFKKTVFQTIDFVRREMTGSGGGFYSALDADSEGDEGRFYTWHWQELQKILSEEELSFAEKHFGISAEGNWENGKNILHVCPSSGWPEGKKACLRESIEKKLLEQRELRVRPGLDNKSLACWNALMLQGLLDAYSAFEEKAFLEAAASNAKFIETSLIDNGTLFRTCTDGQPKLNGYLDDYAATAIAFSSMSMLTCESKWLMLAESLCEAMLSRFYDSKQSLFFYTDKLSEKLITRKQEIFDNVIPSSNALACRAFYIVGQLSQREDFTAVSIKMLRKICPMVLEEAQYLSCWAKTLISLNPPNYTIIAVGEKAPEFVRKIYAKFLPNVMAAGSIKPEKSGLLAGKNPADGKTTLYVCNENACLPPVFSVEEALELVRQTRREK